MSAFGLFVRIRVGRTRALYRTSCDFCSRVTLIPLPFAMAERRGERHAARCKVRGT